MHLLDSISIEWTKIIVTRNSTPFSYNWVSTYYINPSAFSVLWKMENVISNYALFLVLILKRSGATKQWNKKYETIEFWYPNSGRVRMIFSQVIGKNFVTSSNCQEVWGSATSCDLSPLLPLLIAQKQFAAFELVFFFFFPKRRLLFDLMVHSFKYAEICQAWSVNTLERRNYV